MPTIQFYELEDMIPELSAVDPIRMTRIVNPLGFKTRDIAISQVLVIVRQHQHMSGNTLSWMMSTGEYETINGQPVEVVDDEIRVMAWEEAEYVIDFIYSRLLAQDNGYEIKQGLISINDTPLLGSWSYLDVENVDAHELLEKHVPDQDIDEEPAF